MSVNLDLLANAVRQVTSAYLSTIHSQFIGNLMTLLEIVDDICYVLEFIYIAAVADPSAELCSNTFFNIHLVTLFIIGVVRSGSQIRS